MHRIVALLHANWLTARSYRMQVLLSLVALVGMLVPIYFVATALQGVMASRIAGEGGQYFAFLLLGMIALQLLMATTNALPGAVGSALSSGVLESLLATRARLPEILIGLSAYELCWTLLRCAALVGVGVVLGAHFEWSRLLPALGVLTLLIAAHVPFGLFGVAIVLGFRAQSPIGRGLVLLSGFLGGVYYPTSVIPGWMGELSRFVPLSYGLHALRAVWLEGASIRAVATDLGVLLGLTLVLGAVGIGTVALAVRHVRRAGGLTHL